MKTSSLLAFLFFLNFSSAPSFAQEELNRDYYVDSKSYSSIPESDPPRYVKQLNKSKITQFKNIDWIDAGLYYRARLEYRENDFRQDSSRTDNKILSRTQAYFGVKNILDPLRFAIEIQDSRSGNSKFSNSTGDVNKLNLLQAYGEIYFKNTPLINREIKLRAGRMAFEVMDRKMLARDDWGNSGTNFQGFRAIFGKKENDWQFDSFALQPINKSMREYDRVKKDQWFYGAVFSWRAWSKNITLQPFYFNLDQKKSENSAKRQVNSPGIRLFGDFAESFDYDLLATYQFGQNDEEKHRAYGYSAEVGYKSDVKLKPRFSLIYGFASGDKNPNDRKDQRFERFYGFNRPWSNSNIIEWENLKTVKSRIQFYPHKKFNGEASYSFYWLASKSDSWERGGLRDETGSNGSFIGQDFDLRLHYEVSDYLKTTLGYAYFRPEKFVQNLGRKDPSNFLYLELNFNVF